MKTITLPLKKKWFDMIASGQKTEEYRDMTPYWHKRLTIPVWQDTDRYFSLRHFDKVVFTLGYPRKDDLSRRMEYEIESISATSNCNPDWGAEPDRSYFVIKIGKRL